MPESMAGRLTPKDTPRTPVLPGGPGGGFFRQADQHLGDIRQADRGGEHQEEEILLQVAHPAEQDFVLLQGVLLGGRAGLDDRVMRQAAAPAARVLARIGMAYREQDMRHVGEARKDPLRQAHGQRLQADLAVGAAHRRFEGRHAARRSGAGFFQRGCEGRNAVALHDPHRRLWIIENAGGQVQKADL